MADINEQTPSEGINEYESGMTSANETDAFLSLLSQQGTEYDKALSLYAGQQQSQEANRLQQEQLGMRPTGVGVSPTAGAGPVVAPQDLATLGGTVLGTALGGTAGGAVGMGIGSAISGFLGSDSMLQQSLEAGTGDLIKGTGDTFEFLKAVVTPWDPDVDQNTTIGDYLQRKGSEISNKNQIFVADELKGVGWGQLASPRFWATDVAKLLPYSMSFFLPAGVAARGTRLLLNSNKVYKGARTLGVGEKLYKPVISKATKRQAKRRGLQKGEEFAKMEMRKGIDVVTTTIGGGVGGNFAEGAFVAGETMQQALADGLTPQEAQAAASQVWRDNTNWVLADIAQFGLVFGGLGRLARGFRNLPKPIPFGQKIAPFIQAGATGAIEGTAEQYQEVYQEWIKNRAIAEKKGLDYMSYTDFFKSPEMLQTRVSAFALGSAMGSRGGYVDAIAERDYQLQEQRRRLGDLIDLNEFEQAQAMRKDIIAYTVIDENGNAQLAKSRVERMVAEGQMREEVGQQIIEAIEQYEDIYESTHKGNSLSQAGKRQIFLARVEIAERKAAIERSNEQRQQELDLASENIKDPVKLKQAQEEINNNFDNEVQIYNEEIQQQEELIENLATVRLGKLTKDKTRVKRSSKGLTPDQFSEFTSEGVKTELEKPGLISRAATAVKEGAAAVKEGVTKAVETVREKGFKQTAKDIVTSEGAIKLKNFLQDQFAQGKNYVKKYLSQNAPKTSQALEREINAAKEELGNRNLTKEQIKEKAKEIVNKIKKTDLKGASGEVLDKITEFVEGKLNGTITEKFVDIANSLTKKVDELTEKVEARRQKVSEEDIETGRKVAAQTATTEEVQEAEVVEKPKKKSKKTAKQESDKVKPKETSDTDTPKKYTDFINKYVKRFANRKDSDARKPVQKYITRVDEKGSLIRGYLRAALEEKFPGTRIEFANRQLIEGFGAPAAAVFFSSTILVNPRSAMQTDLIHELSHPYYQSIAGTPLQKRLNTLLIKRRILTPNGNLVKLIDNIQYNYPLLTRYKMGKSFVTGGDILSDFLENRRNDVDSPLSSLLDSIVNAAEAGNTLQYKNAVQSLFTQLSSEGVIKRLNDESQFGLLEEAFAYSNEDFNRKGGITNVIENKTDAQKYESILKRLYKRVAGLASREQAKSAVEQVIPETRLMDYDQMMTYIQNNFNTLNVENQFKQNSYSKKAMLKQAKFDVISTKGLFNIIQQQVISKGKKGEEAVQLIAQEIYKQNYKSYNTQKQTPPFEVTSMEHDTLLRKIRSQVERVTFKEYQKIVDDLIKAVDKRLNQGERSDDSLEFSFNREAEQVAEENDKGNIYDQEETLFGETTSKLIQAYSFEESKKNDKNPVNVKDLLSELHSLGQKTKKGNTFTFVTNVTESENPSVVRFVKFLNNKLKKESLVDALLLEMSIDFANKKIETMKEVGFMRGDNGVTTWVPGVSLSTDEARWQSSMTREANERWFKRKGTTNEQVKSLIDNIRNNENIIETLSVIYGDSSYWQFVDKRKLSETGNVYNYKNKRYASISQLIQNNREDFVKQYKGRYYLQISNGFDNLLADLIVQSRAKNYITQVNDVSLNPTLTINKENSIHNKNENYADLSEKDINAYYQLMEDLGFFNEKGFTNIYAAMLGDGTGKEHNISMLSGVFSTPQASQQDTRRNRKYVKMDSLELMLTDFNEFLYSVSRYKRGELAYYDQAIAVFGAAKRRYYIKTPVAQTAEQRQELLEMAYNGGYNEAKYADGTRVNPFKIIKTKDGFALSGLNQYSKKFKSEVIKDSKQIKLNDLIGEKGKKLKDIDLKNYILNYSINKYMAQQMFIGNHNEHKNEIDYIKRADGAIKRHTPHDRNTPIEFVAFEDIVDHDGFIGTDAQAYVLPGDGDIIRKKFGSMRNVGNQFKHVYDYVETNNPNKKVFGRRTFAKFKIDEITPEMEKSSPEIKKIADILRARKEAIGKQKLIAGPEVTGKLHDFTPIATFKSALKVYAPGENYMYNLDQLSVEEVVYKQDEIYNSSGEAEVSLFDSWKGLSGEGFGLQLELDKERHSFHMPSQLFGHHHTNLEEGEQDMVNRMHELAAKAMVGFEESKGKGVIYSNQSTAEERKKDIEFLTKLIGEEFFGNLNTSLAQYAPGLHPQLHNMIQQLAASRLVKFGTKAMFGGTIAYQTSPIGRNLQSYIKVSDLVDKVDGDSYKSALNSLIEQGKDYVVSEAIIPASAKKDGVKIGDLVLGTRIPAHGKQSSVVFVVKGFAAEGIDGARSTIAIPSKVSNVMGSDLDGDAIYLNYSHVGNVPGSTKISPLGIEARVQTNLLKDYQVSANELLDLNLKLLGDIEIDSRRYKEITTPIDIKDIAEEAINKVESFYNKKLVMDNQLLPTGDAQYFNDNVPAQNMIGTIASLQRVLNVMAGHKVGFTFGINIKGYDEVSSLVDIYNEDKPEGFAFSVAQLLNIVLDNAKYQYANKLGLTPNTVNQFTLLSRLGISLSDISIIMNHPIVKLYDKHRGDQSIMTTSISNQAVVNAYKEYYKGVGKKEATNIVKSFAKSGNITLNIEKLKGKNKQSELALFDLLYKTEKLTDEIFSIGKALSVHKAIPQHGHDAQRLINIINEQQKGSFLNPNTLGNFRSDPLVKHSIDLLQKQVDRQKSTSFMYTPEARQVIEYIEDTRKIKLDFSRYEHRRLMQDYYLIKVAEAIPTVNYNNRTIAEVYKILEDYSKQPGENFVKKNLLFSNIEGSPYFENNIQINPNQINKFSVEETIQTLRNEFTLLPTEIKDALLQYDYLKNGLGFKGKSLTPLFEKNYIKNKFDLLDDLLQKEINNNISIEDPAVVDKANELMLAHPQLFKQDEEKMQTTVAEKKKLKGQQSFEPTNTASLKLNKREFYQDHLQELTKTLTFNEYVTFLGYSSNAVNKSDAKTKQYFEDRYQRYLNSLSNVEKLESNMKDLESMSIKKLINVANELQNREDELASPKLLHKIHLAIGNKAMATQSQKLADKTGEVFETTDEDISTIRKWFGANNMTSKRPEVQFMLNEIQREYREYVRQVKSLVAEINVVDRALKKSKSLKGIFNPRQRHLEIYGKMFTEDIVNGKTNGIRLVEKKTFEASNPSQQERDFYNKYQEITARFRKQLGKSGMGEFYIPHVQMGNLEALSARGLLGLYANYLGSTTNIDGVRIKGTNGDGKPVIQSFKYFKDLYLSENGELTMPSGRRINELRKLKSKAEKQLALGKHEDGDPIIATDLEMDTLMEGGLFSRFNAGRTVRAKELTSFDLAENLRQYVRSVTFVHGYGDFRGMNDVSTLVDAVIAVNKNMGNKNTAEYVTKVWRQGFLRKEKQESVFGSKADKAISFMVRWTALVHLGFSAAVGVGNILAGKYQELRSKGGKQFLLGEKRFWTSFTDKDWKGMDILKKYRIVEMSFSDVVGSRDSFSKIEEFAFLPMEISEKWIQGAAFLGELTNEEFESGNISEERVMQINSKIATLHGEGYTQLDQRLLSMYSLGIAAQQFKRWFITLAYNRLKQEDINRFGEYEIGSYRAGYDFVNRMFTGEAKLSDMKKEFDSLPEHRQDAIRSLLRGIGLTAILLLIGAQSDDEEIYSKSIQKLSNDALIFTDVNRFVNYTIPPASISTGRNALQFSKELVTFERYQRDSKFGDRGELKARGTARKILPFKAVTEPLLSK